MKAKIIIASPLQLINGLEAKKYFNIDSVDITFLSDGNKKNEDQISLIIEKLKVESRLSLVKIPKNISFTKRLLFLIKLKNCVDKKNVYDFVILGHFRSIYQATYANFYTAKKVLVDDGTRSLNDLSFLNQGGYNTFNYLLKRVLYSAFFVKPFLIQKQYTFFSYYKPKIKLQNHINLIKNEFSFINKIRENRNEIPVNKKVAFVGQSLVDNKLVSLETYLKLIRGVDTYYKNKYSYSIQIEYYCHRNESDEVLEVIKNVSNWKIVKNELPLELHFLLSPSFPIEIGLFFSSVSETLSILFNEKLKLTSFYILPIDLLYRTEEIETLYRSYKISNNVQLVEKYVDS
ncbi:hypothetical protein [Algibacter lectus]|uniref:hypothetical protein n=1 Tax=Algibacter lectus TaxID=221126 RepID=UPI0026F07DAF|nr:hypothetical protein [Algibacter lectus]MDO7137098.1 hypothetical protein [Algibacter lectus]